MPPEEGLLLKGLPGGRCAAHGMKEHVGEGRAAEQSVRPCCGAKWGHSRSHARRSVGAQSRGIACPLSERRGTGAGGTADGQRGKDVSAAWSEGSVSPQCCLPLLLLAPAGAASLSRCCLQRRSCWLLCCCLFRRECAPVVFAAGFVGCCCGAGPWRNSLFLRLVLTTPLEVYWPWCCTGTPQSTKLTRLCKTGAFLLSLYWCVEWPGFVS